MHFRLISLLIIISSLIIMSCEKLATDPGGDDMTVQTENGVNYWGGAYNDYGYGVVQTADGGYAVAGSQYTSTTSQEDLIMAKFNSQLVFEDTTILGTSGAKNVANDIQQTNDGGYILVGNTFNGTDDDVWIVKLGPTLEKAWEDTIKGKDATFGDDWGNSIQQINSGNYVICGTRFDTDNGEYDIMLWTYSHDGTDGTPKLIFADTDASGTTNTTNDYGSHAQQTSDGGFVIVGTQGNDIAVIKLVPAAAGAYNDDTNFGDDGAGGDGHLAIDVGTNSIDEGIFIQQTADGQYIVVGNTENGTGQLSDVYVNTISNAGIAGNSPITLGGAYDDKASCVRQTTDGGFVLAGEKYRGLDADSEYDVWVVKLTDALTVHWNYTFGGDMNDYASSISQTDDGGYIITGHTMSYGDQSEIILLKLDHDGKIDENIGDLD
mgnify:CR=1 FL=1